MSLEDRLESGMAPAWRPDKDSSSTLIGEVVEISMASSEYQPYPLLVVRTEDGSEIAVHGFHTVLRNELLRQRPQIGERIGIKYLGEQETKPGSKFKSFIGYRLKVDRQAVAFDWNRVGEPEDVGDPYEAPATPVSDPVTVPAGAGEDDIPF